MNNIRVMIFASLLVLLQSLNTHAYDPNTHRALSERAVLASQLDSILKRELDFLPGINGELLGQTIRDWIADGGRLEDNSRRYLHHFHNPLQTWDEAGLRLLGVQLGHSSVLWGQRPELQPGEERFTWDDAREWYFRGLIAEDQADRDANLALTFRTLGQLIHLVQDASVPAHTRNDPHPIYEPLESFVERTRSRNRALFDQLTSDSISFDPSILTLYPNPHAPIPIARIIDTTDPHQVAAVPSAGTNQGMAEYSNANFLSADTIFHNFAFPRVESLGPSFDGHDPGTGRPRTYFPKVLDGEPVEHFIAKGTWTERLRSYQAGDRGYILDPRVLQDYAANLLPRAIGYSGGLLDYFFRGRISVVVSENQPPGDPLIGVRVKVRNVTPHEEAGAGDLIAIMTSDDGLWAVAPTQRVTLSRVEQEVVFDFGQSRIPADTPGLFLRVVYIGPLGFEEDAVIAGGTPLLSGSIRVRYFFYDPLPSGDLFQAEIDSGGTIPETVLCEPRGASRSLKDLGLLITTFRPRSDQYALLIYRNGELIHDLPLSLPAGNDLRGAVFGKGSHFWYVPVDFINCTPYYTPGEIRFDVELIDPLTEETLGEAHFFIELTFENL